MTGAAAVDTLDYRRGPLPLGDDLVAAHRGGWDRPGAEVGEAVSADGAADAAGVLQPARFSHDEPLPRRAQPEPVP